MKMTPSDAILRHFGKTFRHSIRSSFLTDGTAPTFSQASLADLDNVVGREDAGDILDTLIVLGLLQASSRLTHADLDRLGRVFRLPRTVINAAHGHVYGNDPFASENNPVALPLDALPPTGGPLNFFVKTLGPIISKAFRAAPKAMKQAGSTIVKAATKASPTLKAAGAAGAYVMTRKGAPRVMKFLKTGLATWGLWEIADAVVKGITDYVLDEGLTESEDSTESPLAPFPREGPTPSDVERHPFIPQLPAINRDNQTLTDLSAAVMKFMSFIKVLRATGAQMKEHGALQQGALTTVVNGGDEVTSEKVLDGLSSDVAAGVINNVGISTFTGMPDKLKEAIFGSNS